VGPHFPTFKKLLLLISKIQEIQNHSSVLPTSYFNGQLLRKLIWKQVNP
jgi:hypothetical protein